MLFFGLLLLRGLGCALLESAPIFNAFGQSVRSPGVQYRSILGDGGMQWRPAQRAGFAAPAPPPPGPRMQVFFYNLCSKAGPANYSVIPSPTDTCRTVNSGDRVGIGEVMQVRATDCCKACLERPWCLAWTDLGRGTCSLKDNAMPLRRPTNATQPPGTGATRSGYRSFAPAQRLPSPRYANCVTRGTQIIRAADNFAQVPPPPRPLYLP